MNIYGTDTKQAMRGSLLFEEEEWAASFTHIHPHQDPTTCWIRGKEQTTLVRTKSRSCLKIPTSQKN
jgi:hypothetical protein